MSKRAILPVIVSIIIITSLFSGCKPNSEQPKNLTAATTAKVLTAKEIAFKAKDSSQAVQNYAFDATMDMTALSNISGNSQNLDINSIYEGKVFGSADNQKIYMNVKTKSQGMDINMEMYTLNQNGIVTSYLNTGNGWVELSTLGMTQSALKQSIEQSAKNQANMTKSMLGNLDDSSIITDLGDETINGVITKKLEITVSSESWKSALGLTNFGVSTPGSGVNMDDIINSFNGLKMICNIDKQTYEPVRISIDMTEVMSKILNSMGESGGANMTVSKVLMTMNIKDYGKVADFTVPAEALNTK